MASRFYNLTITSLPSSADGDLITRTYPVKARSLAEAESRFTVAGLVNTMDNVIDWRATLASE